jgi:hypothetical protein
MGQSHFLCPHPFPLSRQQSTMCDGYSAHWRISGLAIVALERYIRRYMSANNRNWEAVMPRMAHLSGLYPCKCHHASSLSTCVHRIQQFAPILLQEPLDKCIAEEMAAWQSQREKKRRSVSTPNSRYTHFRCFCVRYSPRSRCSSKPCRNIRPAPRPTCGG